MAQTTPHGQTTVGTTRTRLLFANPRRKLLRFTNHSTTEAVFIGGRELTSGNGERVAAGTGDVWDGFTGELFAITAANTAVVGVLEVIDDGLDIPGAVRGAVASWEWL